ncbi:hypothetical protein Tsubulata_016134, partial [Turnera subulata]
SPLFKQDYVSSLSLYFLPNFHLPLETVPHPCINFFQMGWLRSLILSPLKKLWERLHSSHRKRRGIYILYKDVKSCPCEDVHILWSILVESHPAALPPT